MRIYIIGQQGEKQHVWHFQGVTLSRKKAIRACVTPKFFYFETKLGKLFGIAPSKAKDEGITPEFPLKDVDLSAFSTAKLQAMANVVKQINAAMPTAKQAARRLQKGFSKL